MCYYTQNTLELEFELELELESFLTYNLLVSVKLKLIIFDIFYKLY